MAKQGKKKKGGKPEIEFQNHFVEWAEKLTREGKSMRSLAKVFEVSERTLYTWQHKYPELRTAILAGRDFFRNEVLENTLYTLAVGGKEVKEEEYELRPAIFDENGNILQEPTMILTKVKKRKLLPNLGAIKQLQNNTHPEKRFNNADKDAAEAMGEGFGKAVGKLIALIEDDMKEGEKDESVHSAR